MINTKNNDGLNISGLLEDDVSNSSNSQSSSSNLEIFNKHLSEIEKFECEIKHLNSRLHFSFKRKDTPHLSTNGYCHAA